MSEPGDTSAMALVATLRKRLSLARNSMSPDACKFQVPVNAMPCHGEWFWTWLSAWICRSTPGNPQEAARPHAKSELARNLQVLAVLKELKGLPHRLLMHAHLTRLQAGSRTMRTCFALVDH